MSRKKRHLDRIAESTFSRENTILKLRSQKRRIDEIVF
jgi:hypothetical protein